MVDHIYGRINLPFKTPRPHMFLKELSLHLECLRRDIAQHDENPSERLAKTIGECRANLPDPAAIGVGLDHGGGLDGRCRQGIKRAPVGDDGLEIDGQFAVERH